MGNPLRFELMKTLLVIIIWLLCSVPLFCRAWKKDGEINLAQVILLPVFGPIILTGLLIHQMGKAFTVGLDKTLDFFIWMGYKIVIKKGSK